MRARAGFTLIELVVVMLVLSAMAMVTLPAFRGAAREDDMTVAQRRVELLFRLARDSAARSGTRVSVVIDSATSRVWLDAPTVATDAAATPSPTTNAIEQLAVRPVNGEELELPGSVRLQVSKERATFSFAPTGVAFADSLWLMSTFGTRLITINPWTGDVVVH